MKLLILNETACQSYGVSLDHTGLPATQHKWTHPVLTPSRQAGTRFTCPGGMEGRVDLGVMQWLSIVIYLFPVHMQKTWYKITKSK